GLGWAPDPGAGLGPRLSPGRGAELGLRRVPELGTGLGLGWAPEPGAGRGPRLSRGRGTGLGLRRVPELGTGLGLGWAPELGTAGRLRRWLSRRVWPRCSPASPRTWLAGCSRLRWPPRGLLRLTGTPAPRSCGR